MYINLMPDENKNYYISYWLLLTTFLVAIMIIVGGLTRLTDSGLSITKWDLFIGIIPPLNSTAWQNAFNEYKQIPEFKLLNSSMTIKSFKFIFWWEYIHRLLGRLIGIVYLVPLIYFSYKRLISKNNLIFFYMIFFLILFQGFLGWYMVKSGLSVNTDVSHYRLSIHLTFAFLIYILLFWSFLKYNGDKFIYSKKIPFNLTLFFIFLIILQISMGALVSGLEAGKIYQTWPLMGNSYFPSDSSYMDLLSFNSFETPSIVQFIHRNISYLIFSFFIIILKIVFTNDEYFCLRKISIYVFLTLIFQIFLGILTILSGANIYFSSLHQFGSIILITTSLILVFKTSKIN